MAVVSAFADVGVRPEVFAEKHKIKEKNKQSTTKFTRWVQT
jgi:hypothetical protein